MIRIPGPPSRQAVTQSIFCGKASRLSWCVFMVSFVTKTGGDDCNPAGCPCCAKEDAILMDQNSNKLI